MTAADSDLYAANIGAWPDHCPAPSNVDHDRVRIDTQGEWPSLSVESEGRWLTLHSRRDPIGEALQLLDERHAMESRVLFVIGLGFGYLLDALERRGWSGRVVAFEPEPAVADAFLQRRDWRRWLGSGGLTLLFGPEYRGLDAIVPSLEPDRETPVILENPVVTRLYPEGTARAHHLATRAWFGANANQDARRENAARYLLNTLRNVPRLAREGDAGALARAANGVPAILVGAGPSLDANIAHLTEIGGRALIIAADTALRPLVNAGIAPHLVVAVDPTEQNARHLIEIPHHPETWLVAEGSIDPYALDDYAGRTFFGRLGPHHPWPWLASIGIERGLLRSWGSVLTTVLDVAIQLGSDPIVFAGADLAFTDNRPYARGTSYEEDWRRSEAWGTRVEANWANTVSKWPLVEEYGVDGRLVRTAPHMREFRDWIVDETRRYADRRFVNATGSGILLGGAIEQASLLDAIAALPPLHSNFVDRIRTAYRPDLEAVARARAEAARLAETFNPGASPVADWVTFSCRSDIQDDIRHALTTDARPRRHLYVVRPVERPVATAIDSPPEIPTPAPDYSLLGERLKTSDRLIESLSEGDRAALAELVDSLEPDAVITVVTLGHRHDLNLDRTRRAAQRLAPSGMLVLIDEVGTVAGAELHRVAYPVLNDDSRLWMLDRRFIDHTSRLVFISSDPAKRSALPALADAPKWDPEHRAVARRLAPIIWSAFRPASVRDIGCGAGYWIEALHELGAREVEGLTPAPDGNVVPTMTARIARRAIGRLEAEARRDLCLCLDVAHRLHPERHGTLVAACVDSADVVIFSAWLPGAPYSTYWDRPLTYWTAKFLDHGYALEDTLRPLSEQAWGFPGHAADQLLVFRRVMAPGEQAGAVRANLIGQARRIEDLYLQDIWWQVALMHQPKPQEQVSAPPPPEPPPAPEPPALPAPPVTPPVRFRLAAHRLSEAGNARRVFKFRTDAARWYASHHAEQMELFEDGRQLPRLASVDEVRASAEGGWTLWRDEITLAASDGVDPRTNGRIYELLVPRHVAWAEQQPADEVLRLGL